MQTRAIALVEAMNATGSIAPNNGVDFGMMMNSTHLTHAVFAVVESPLTKLLLLLSKLNAKT